MFDWEPISGITSLLLHCVSSKFPLNSKWNDALQQIQSDSISPEDQGTLLRLLFALKLVNRLNLFQKKPSKVTSDEDFLSQLETKIKTELQVPAQQFQRDHSNFGTGHL